MKTTLVLGIMETVDKWGETIQEFLRQHGRNPILWMVFFGVGLLIFFTTYNALQKEK